MARAAIIELDVVDSVSADPTEHTVTVTFDDTKTDLATIEAALNDAGYMVKGKDKVEAGAGAPS